MICEIVLYENLTGICENQACGEPGVVKLNCSRLFFITWRRFSFIHTSISDRNLSLSMPRRTILLSRLIVIPSPITQLPGGPLDKPLNDIAAKFGATIEQILMAWTKAKGAVVVTSSSKKERLQGYIAAGDIILSPDDIATIDAAGALGEEKPVESR